MLTAPEDSDRTEYASFAVEMVRIECIASEMSHLNRCLADSAIPSYCKMKTKYFSKRFRKRFN